MQLLHHLQLLLDGDSGTGPTIQETSATDAKGWKPQVEVRKTIAILEMPKYKEQNCQDLQTWNLTNFDLD